MKRFPSRYTKTTKGTKFHTKKTEIFLLLHIVELSTAVEKS